ncbi:radical SAM protein [Chimaeribacter arupi]|uniref:radical SAM/SPASM domain-containing protein n=1 Tax=Chimaeribacter arupi TaxID=2060066 RepID=UPI002711D50D|nr:radical SAM protein [Chimaeribacter arupi]WKZ92385.1 radical SAM protein [Chimaeribacter arupi]
MPPLFRPDRLTIQWHITDSCNLRCRHCYQHSWRGEHIRWPVLYNIANHILAFHQQLSGKIPLPLLITLTGGEPFTHPDFFRLLAYLQTHPARPHIAILTNGTLITAKRAAALAKFKLAFIQLSVEGVRKTHDDIRGMGNLQKVLNATQYLVQAGQRVLWSFTAHRENWQDFPLVAELAQKYAVNRLWLDRLIPCRETLPQSLSQEETQHLFRTMLLTKRRLSSSWIKNFIGKYYPQPQIEISMLRALQFQWSGEKPYRCRAGEALLTIMPDGTVYPCRRLPITVGNLHHTSLMDIYQHSPFIRQLRAFHAPSQCRMCTFASHCRGGLRCLAWAVTQDAFNADPGCPFTMPA